MGGGRVERLGRFLVLKMLRSDTLDFFGNCLTPMESSKKGNWAYTEELGEKRRTSSNSGRGVRWVAPVKYDASNNINQEVHHLPIGILHPSKEKRKRWHPLGTKKKNQTLPRSSNRKGSCQVLKCALEPLAGGALGR